MKTTIKPKITILNNEPETKKLTPIEFLGFINTEGDLVKRQRMSDDNFYEFKIQKVPRNERDFDCVIFGFKHDGGICIYLGNFNDGVL